MDNPKHTIEYCLYARKSSESDERQAMSIDSQIHEMTGLVRKEKLYIKEVRQESHSAKQSGERPVFNALLNDIEKGVFTGILTWAPDRLSRNAGDLGRLVDLMDQNKLQLIRTYSQSFSNNPNEKFLLMILCSQAKLENDNRGINVKRGLRTKCEAGIRPGIAPLGYKNVLRGNRIAVVEKDPNFAPLIKEMFRKVGEQGFSGRMVKKWLDDIGFRTKRGCMLALGRIYEMLQNPFYYGEFRYGEKLYKGMYEQLITKTLFEKVQVQLQVAPRQWNKQLFPFKKICKCGSCGGSVTAEIKYRRTKANVVNTHIYYHCNRIKKYDCEEPYITEQELIKQLIVLLPQIRIDSKYLMQECAIEVKRLQHLKATITVGYNPQFVTTPTNIEQPETTIEVLKEYLLHVLQFGTPEERLKILGGIKSKFILYDRKLQFSRINGIC